MNLFYPQLLRAVFCDQTSTNYADLLLAQIKSNGQKLFCQFLTKIQRDL